MTGKNKVITIPLVCLTANGSLMVFLIISVMHRQSALLRLAVCALYFSPIFACLPLYQPFRLVRVLHCLHPKMIHNL